MVAAMGAGMAVGKVEATGVAKARDEVAVMMEIVEVGGGVE